MSTQRHSNPEQSVIALSSSFKSRVLRTFKLLSAVYLGLSLLAIIFESHLVYHGVSTPRDFHYAGCEEHYIRSEDEVTFHAISYKHPNSQHWAIFFHGNAGNLEHRLGFLKELSFETKRNVLAVDYRGFGKSDGSPSETYLKADADSLIRYAEEELRIKLAETYLIGRSLGGGVAVELASKHTFKALILINTFTSLPDVASELYPFLPTHLIMRNRFNSLAITDQIQIPVFQTHGTKDELIPFHNGRQLYDQFEAHKDFWVHKNGTHNSVLPGEFYRNLKQFLDIQ